MDSSLPRKPFQDLPDPEETVCSAHELRERAQILDKLVFATNMVHFENPDKRQTSFTTYEQYSVIMWIIRDAMIKYWDTTEHDTDESLSKWVDMVRCIHGPATHIHTFLGPEIPNYLSTSPTGAHLA